MTDQDHPEPKRAEAQNADWSDVPEALGILAGLANDPGVLEASRQEALLHLCKWRRELRGKLDNAETSRSERCEIAGLLRIMGDDL